MDTPKRQVSFLESLPPDIWAYLACYLPGEQLGRLMMTGATLLWQRLKSPTVVKSIKLGKDYLLFKSFPAFLRELQSLEELMIDIRNDDWIAKLGITIDLLPPGLRKLEFRGNGAESSKSASKLFGEPGAALTLSQHLPNLETLDLERLTISSNSWMAHSPPSLTFLSLHHWDGGYELPASLIHFTAYEVSLSANLCVSRLPPRLESFVVSEDFSGVEWLLPLLPPTTLKLSLGSYLDYSQVSRSPQKLLEQLPKSLISLNAPYSDVLNFESYPDLIVLLPSRLTELRIKTCLPCSVWPLLPQQLTTLSITAPEEGHTFTVTCTLTGNDGTWEVQSVPFDHLPRSITHLELRSPYGDMAFCGGPPNLPKQSYFPPYLTYLSIPEIHPSPEMAQLLPSSLTHLKVGALCERVCEHLPRGIKTLKSDRTLMSPNLIKCLPKSLKHLRLSLISYYNPWFDYNTGTQVDSVSTLPEYTIHELCTSNRFDWKASSPLPPTLNYLAIDDAAAWRLIDAVSTTSKLARIALLQF